MIPLDEIGTDPNRFRGVTMDYGRAYAASWFGQEARVRTVTWDEFRRIAGADHAGTSWQHLWRNHCVSIDKARTRLGYAPAQIEGLRERKII